VKVVDAAAKLTAAQIRDSQLLTAMPEMSTGQVDPCVRLGRVKIFVNCICLRLTVTRSLQAFLMKIHS